MVPTKQATNLGLPGDLTLIYLYSEFSLLINQTNNDRYLELEEEKGRSLGVGSDQFAVPSSPSLDVHLLLYLVELAAVCFTILPSFVFFFL